jgi:hypothetical protein
MMNDLICIVQVVAYEVSPTANKERKKSFRKRRRGEQVVI